MKTLLGYLGIAVLLGALVWVIIDQLTQAYVSAQAEMNVAADTNQGRKVFDSGDSYSTTVHAFCVDGMLFVVTHKWVEAVSRPVQVFDITGNPKRCQTEATP